MKQGLFTITENVALTKTVYRMRLSGDTSEITVSGQFVNILLDGFYLRRPISVCDRENGLLTIVYISYCSHSVQVLFRVLQLLW